MKQRYICNKAILSILSDLVTNHPNMRFMQLLQAARVICKDKNLFYEESSETLKRLVDSVCNNE